MADLTSILNEAAEAVRQHEWPLVDQVDSRYAHANHNYVAWCAVCRGDVAAVAAVVLRVAETRLRGLAADIRADQWPTSGERAAAAAAVDRAADTLTDGMDDEGADDATV